MKRPRSLPSKLAADNTHAIVTIYKHSGTDATPIHTCVYCRQDICKLASRLLLLVLVCDGGRWPLLQVRGGRGLPQDLIVVVGLPVARIYIYIWRVIDTRIYIYM